jgi:hypothetical protein
MCLSVVEKVLRPIDWTEREGWKAFDHNYSRDLIFQWRYTPGLEDALDDVVPMDKWLKATVTTIAITLDGKLSYRAGFHVFPNRTAARAWSGSAIVKVRCRGVQTIGKQDGLDVFVCREMFVPSGKRKARRK